MKCCQEISGQGVCGKKAICVVLSPGNKYPFCADHLRKKCLPGSLYSAAKNKSRQIIFMDKVDEVLFSLEGFNLSENIKVKTLENYAL